jgi:hypothetical protein
MPYIKQKIRDNWDEIVSSMNLDPAYVTIGELNYLITNILLSYGPEKYEDYNALIGMLECCQLEFYRRAVACYEDKKIKENGDLYQYL